MANTPHSTNTTDTTNGSSFTDKLKITGQYLLPKHALSRCTGFLASKRLGFVTQFFIKQFIKAYQVDMNEAAREEPSQYTTFNDFFTRELKDGIRPIDDTEQGLCMPVDGTISQFGRIFDDRMIQAKGHHFTVQDLLGGDPDDAAPYQDGEFMTIYLAPSDYHRIHVPCDAVLQKMVFVPGDLFSVNPLTAQHVPNLFARNERVVAFFESEHGPFTMTFVGATIVASIETVWAGTIAPLKQQVLSWDYANPQPIVFKKGEEVARFKLGSTVILTFPQGSMQWHEGTCAELATTRLGQPLATWNSAD